MEKGGGAGPSEKFSLGWRYGRWNRQSRVLLPSQTDVRSFVPSLASCLCVDYLPTPQDICNYTHTRTHTISTFKEIYFQSPPDQTATGCAQQKQVRENCISSSFFPSSSCTWRVVVVVCLSVGQDPQDWPCVLLRLPANSSVIILEKNKKLSQDIFSVVKK